MIRLLKIYLTLVFLLVTTFCMAQKSELKFSKDGKFKIVQFTDVHFKYGNRASDIASVVYDMGEGIVRGKKYISILIMVLSFIAVYFLNISAVYIILACGVLGAVRTLLAQRGGKTS